MKKQMTTNIILNKLTPEEVQKEIEKYKDVIINENVDKNDKEEEDIDNA